MLPSILFRVRLIILRVIHKIFRLKLSRYVSWLLSVFFSAIKCTSGSDRDAVRMPETNLLPPRMQPALGISYTSLSSDVLIPSHAEEKKTSVISSPVESTEPQSRDILTYRPAQSSTDLEEGSKDGAFKRTSPDRSLVEFRSQSLKRQGPNTHQVRSKPSSVRSLYCGASLPQGSLVPILPTQTDRLRRGHRLPILEINKEIKPCTTTFKQENAPEQWTRHIHPLGQPYYHKSHHRRIYITDTNITDADELAAVDSIIDQLEQLILSQGCLLPDNIQVCLELSHNGDSGCGYYMIDTAADTQCIFWMHSFNTQSLQLDQPKYPYARFMRADYSLCSEYWMHCRLFPHCIDMNEDVLDELRGILTYFLVDVIRYSESTIPFSREDVVQLLDVMNEMKGLWLLGNTKPYVVCSIASVMLAIADRRVANHYGQHNCILYNSTSNSPSQRTFLIKLFSPPLFSAPDRYLRLLHNVNPNDFIYRRSWPQFIALLEKPWNDCILYATVLLAVNISYLAVPDVESAGDAMSAGQIASLCSIILSIGCIVVGLILVNEDHTEPKVGGYLSRAYFENLKSRLFGYEPLAILYSLPFALFMWSMLTFVVAVALLSFWTNDVQRGITAFPASIVLCLIAWEIKVHWKSSS